MSALAWLRERDRGLSALRRAGRAALVMPAMFALGDVVIGNPAIATFAAFGSFATRAPDAHVGAVKTAAAAVLVRGERGVPRERRALRYRSLRRGRAPGARADR